MTQSKAPRPLLTIAITCYNAELSIRRALDSALAQTWTPREIVIVDDGSTDRSGVVLEEVERTHDDVHLIRHSSNRGVAEARNTLLTQAEGTFIAFFDDDDESAPDRLEAAVPKSGGLRIESCRRGSLLLLESSCRSRRGTVSNVWARWHRPADPAPSGPMVADYVLGLFNDDGRHSWGMLGSGTLMARTEALRALGGFDGRFRRCAERDLAIRAALTGCTFHQRRCATRYAISHAQR